MAEKKTLQQLLLEKLFSMVHKAHSQEIPYNKCRDCNAIVRDVVCEAMEPEDPDALHDKMMAEALPHKAELLREKLEKFSKENFEYDDMGCTPYDSFQED